MSGSVNNVNFLNSDDNKHVKPSRPEQIVVKSGETLSGLAKKYGMSVNDFMAWTGLKKSTLNAGQKITLPMAEIPKGKGIMALIRDNNMTLEEFGKLNKLPKPYSEYKASAGEKFYIVNHKNTKDVTKSETKPETKTEKTDTQPKSETQTNTPAKPSNNGVHQNKTQWNSLYTPEELSANIYDKSVEHWGAVGKPDFDALIDQINSKNASSVIKAYTQNTKNKDQESLINTIVSEVRSDKQKRKEAVMHIYDALAKEYGAPDSIRESFEKELNEQFESFGMVNTKKLDETINRIMASPEELAKKMENDIDHKSSAVGKDSFNELISLVNKNNASEVIKAYNDLKTGESLIEGITSEIGSSKDSRKEAVMHIYDALAAQKNTPKAKRETFETELNDQFNSFGMVNTEKLDEMINEMLNSKSISSSSSKTSTTTAGSNNKIKFQKNPEVKTAAQWRRGAIAAAKNEAKQKYKEFCKANNIKYNENDLDLTPMERIPEPVAKNGTVVADISPVLQPTTKPNGKVVILNPGHGGYSSVSGNFDPGSYSFIKKKNGKYAPLLEYEKMKDYAEKASEKLRAEGYTVVIIGGHSQTIAKQDSIINLVQDLSKGKLTNKKYDKDDIVFVSLHADSEPGKSGSGVCYDSRFEDDTYLANVLMNTLNEDEWIHSSLSERVWGQRGLQVLYQTEQNPSVLLEVEYVNGSKSKNLDSSAFQGKFLDKLTSGLNRYFDLD